MMRILVSLLAITAMVVGVAAEPAPLGHIIIPVTSDSGILGNETAEHQVVYATTLESPGAPWVRVVFDTVHLEGDSYLRISSLLTGETQRLDASGIVDWQDASARFAGSEVLVELVASTKTDHNSVTISHLVAGAPVTGSDVDSDTAQRVCAVDDTRVASNSQETVRLVGSFVCTGFVTDWGPTAGDPFDRVLMTAGHCFGIKDSTITVGGTAGGTDGEKFDFTLYKAPSVVDCTAAVPGGQVIVQFTITSAAADTAITMAGKIQSATHRFGRMDGRRRGYGGPLN